MEGCEEVLMSLGLGSALVSKTIAEFVTRNSTIGNVQNRLSKVEEYVEGLEEEMRKIYEFKTELPICMFLLSDAIVYMKEVLRRMCKQGSGVEVEKQVLKEIDLMKDSEEEKSVEVVGDCVDKKSWSSTIQLWSTGFNPDSEFTEHKVEEVSKSNIYSDLETLERKESPVTELSLEPPVASTLVGKIGASDVKTGIACSGPNRVQLDSRNGLMISHHNLQQQRQSCRKQRRCWSPELHKSFVNALQELGGPQVATPKQIRDLMRVDGLTNDEVKSHLQKYRLHIRRAPNKQMDSPTNQSTGVFGVSWNDQDHSSEFSKHSKDKSGSPPGPLDLYPHHENDGSYD